MMDATEAFVSAGGKSIIQFDANGVVTQVTLQAAEPMEAISDRLTTAGVDHILYDGQYKASEVYVDVPTRTVLKKPDIAITGAIRPVKADGADTLTLTIAPSEFTVSVIMNRSVQVHQEDVTDGLLEFQTETPATYQVYISAAHPYQATMVEIEAMN